MNKCLNLEFDVVLSFAGEDRSYVDEVANYLRKSGVKVFYDLYEDVNLWGKDLYQHLDDIYQNKAKYAVIFISEYYAKKLWTNHELKSAQARAFTENQEYILPAKFDDTEIPGIRKTVGYVSLKKLDPNQFAEKIIKKLGDIEPENFLPEKITYVQSALKEIYPHIDEDEIEDCTQYLFNRLRYTTSTEKQFLATFFMHACRHDITEWHQDISYLERVTKLNRGEILKILNDLTNIEFEYKIVKITDGCVEDGNEHDIDMLKVKFSPRHEFELDDFTLLLSLMYFGAMSGKCEECSVKTLNRLDFSGLQQEISEEDFDAILSCIPDEEED